MTNAAADSGSRPGSFPGRDLRLVAGGSEHAPDGTRDAHDAVVAVYQAEYTGLARLAFLLVGDRHRAEDLAHDAFVRLYEHWDDLDDTSKALAYLRTTTSNLAMSHHRRDKTRRKHAAAADPDPTDTVARSAESEALSRSARPDVVDALQQLSPKQRTAVVLRHWLRLTEGEIAESLGCSVGAARTHLFRGHQSLADLLGGLR